MAMENFLDRKSSFPFERIGQSTELLNMGYRKSTRKSTSTTSFYKGHYVVRVYGIIYHRGIFLGGDGCFWSYEPVSSLVSIMSIFCQTTALQLYNSVEMYVDRIIFM